MRKNTWIYQLKDTKEAIMRNFENFLNTMKESIANFRYFTDFDKTFKNIEQIKELLEKFNVLTTSDNVERDFVRLYNEDNKVLEILPLFIAVTKDNLKICDFDMDVNIDFKELNYPMEIYLEFMRRCGITDLFEQRKVKSVPDFVLGVYVGLDSNGRKNRSGNLMENIVENYLIDAGLTLGKTYFKQMPAKQIKAKFGLDLSPITNNGQVKKIFDFVFVNKSGTVFGVETNVYISGGSKLNETARSYKQLALEAREVDGFEFVWVTDGTGWKTAKNNLKETYDVLPTLYNLKDLKDGALSELANK